MVCGTSSLADKCPPPAAEQRERMRLMREIVSLRNVYRWAGQMLLDAADLRRRKRIIEIVSRQRDAKPAALLPALMK